MSRVAGVPAGPFLIVMVVVPAKAPFRVGDAADADPSSTVVVPSASINRPAATALIPLTIAPPVKPVHWPSRVSDRSTSFTEVVPETTDCALILPEMTGARR